MGSKHVATENTERPLIQPENLQLGGRVGLAVSTPNLFPSLAPHGIELLAHPQRQLHAGFHFKLPAILQFPLSRIALTLW